MVYISDEFIDNLIKEDVPYIDLTTLALGIGEKDGIIRYKSREDTVICGSEEVSRIFSKLNIETISFKETGSVVRPGDIIIEGKGKVEALQMAWKISMNILEYSSGIATRTKTLVDKAKEVNPDIEIFTTRKIFPGTKVLSIKAIIAGGAFPHRLGLSETVLIFKQHTNFLGGIDGLIAKLKDIKTKLVEKKIIVEVEDKDSAVKLCKAGVDGLQFDKVEPKELKEIVNELKKINPKILLIGTGGITSTNVKEYAKTGIDAVSTTSVYFGKPSDIGVTITEN